LLWNSSGTSFMLFLSKLIRYFLIKGFGDKKKSFSYVWINYLCDWRRSQQNVLNLSSDKKIFLPLKFVNLFQNVSRTSFIWFLTKLIRYFRRLWRQKNQFLTRLHLSSLSGFKIHVEWINYLCDWRRSQQNVSNLSSDK
jgi:hypothetical protein